jgi:hypothetical protein
MKTLGKLLLIGLICGTIALGTARSAQAPFSISLAATDQSVKAGADVWVKIQLTNKSQQDLSAPVMETNGVDTEYQYDVRGTNGAAPNKVPNAHPEIQIGSIKSRILKPGQSSGWQEVRVSKVYDLTHPGEYMVQVSREVPGQKEVVKSNTVTVIITP